MAPSDLALEPPKNWLKRVWAGADTFVRVLKQDGDADARTYAARELGLLLTLGPKSAPPETETQFEAAADALVERWTTGERDDVVASSIVFALAGAAAWKPWLIEELRRAKSRSDLGEITRIALATVLIESDDKSKGIKRADVTDIDVLMQTLCRFDEFVQHNVRTYPGRSTRWGRPTREEMCGWIYEWCRGDHNRVARVRPALLAAGVAEEQISNLTRPE